jgi:hypothetical protein
MDFVESLLALRACEPFVVRCGNPVNKNRLYRDQLPRGSYVGQLVDREHLGPVHGARSAQQPKLDDPRWSRQRVDIRKRPSRSCTEARAINARTPSAPIR